MGGASRVEADDPADVFAPVDEAVAAGDADRAIVLLSAAIRDLTAGGERRRAILTQIGNDAALTTDDVVEAALAAEEMFKQSSMAPHTAATLHRLGDLNPTTLAIIHCSSYQGDGAKAPYDLAAAYEQQYLAN